MTNKQNKQPLVPKLRFPEFRGNGEWGEIDLGRLAKRVTRKNTAKVESHVLTNSAEFGVLDQRDYFEKDIANKGNLGSYFIVECGDYVYNPRISSFAPVGPISKNNLRTGVMSPLYTVFRFDNSDNSFYEHYFRSTRWHQHLRRISNSGARHDRMSITNDAFMRMPVPAPEPAEQQKIADCLGSLDELIGAHSAKRDALQDHKKGLLQQLFPAEGQTTPKLRFPEFENAGKWKESTFGEFVHKSFYGTSKSTSATGMYPVIRMGNMTGGRVEFGNLVYIDLDKNEFQKIALKKGDILLNRTNSAKLVGKISVFERDDKFITASYIVTFRLKEKRVDPQFCNYLLNTPENQYNIRALATRSISQCNINPSAFKKKLKIRTPLVTEQQKIADFLSNLDALIAAQTDQIAALKEHKKGLMQQLFPNPELSKT